jgi:non-specific serine/threonine protein kinase
MPTDNEAGESSTTSPAAATLRVASLTQREREVLDLVTLGLSNAEIARHLFISDGTVRKHIENAFLKLGVHSRTQAASIMVAARDLPALPDHAVRPPELPRYLTSFVGRRRALEQINELLEGTRLLTLTGPGGVGKTRLALRAAGDLASRYAAGAWFADLGGLVDPSLVPQAVASTLSVREQPGYGVIDTLVHYLRPKRLLLLLDNCEHLLPPSAELADALLRACPDLQVVATSRQALGIAGETVYPVPSLSVPAADRLPLLERMLDWEAVHLMVERAKAAGPGFALDQRNAQLVLQICRRLDGIPLAIELAAALVRSRPLDLIAAGLDDRFRILVGGSRTAVPRQQTLRATVDWSYALLADAEQSLLRRLSVFAGGFSTDATEAVCADDYGGHAISDLVALLADKSLVVLDSDGVGGRYRLLETVRDYAGQRLVEAGEDEALRARHRDWCLALVDAAREHMFGGPQQGNWLARFDREHDNLRAALEWSRLHRDASDALLRMAAGVWRFWEIRGHLAEGRKWLESALAMTRDQVSEMRANALTAAGVLAFMQGDYAASFALHEESVALHRALDDPISVAYALSNLGNVATELGDLEAARSFHQEAASLHRDLGHEPERDGASLHLAEIIDRQGDVDGARALFESTLENLERLAEGPGDAGQRTFATWLLSYGLAMHAAAVLKHGDRALARTLALRSLFIYRRLGDGREEARILALLADVSDAQGDSSAAIALVLEALSKRHALGDRPGVAAVLEHVAKLAARIDPARAAHLLGAAEALREQMATPVPMREQAEHEKLRSTLSSALSAETYDEAIQAGRLATLADTVTEASGITRRVTNPP